MAPVPKGNHSHVMGNQIHLQMTLVQEMLTKAHGQFPALFTECAIPGSIFCKGRNNKYFRFCDPYNFCYIFPPLPS